MFCRDGKFWVCAVQGHGHQPPVSAEHMKCGHGTEALDFQCFVTSIHGLKFKQPHMALTTRRDAAVLGDISGKMKSGTSFLGFSDTAASLEA